MSEQRRFIEPCMLYPCLDCNGTGTSKESLYGYRVEVVRCGKCNGKGVVTIPEKELDKPQEFPSPDVV